MLPQHIARVFLWENNDSAPVWGMESGTGKS